MKKKTKEEIPLIPDERLYRKYLDGPGNEVYCTMLPGGRALYCMAGTDPVSVFHDYVKPHEVDDRWNVCIAFYNNPLFFKHPGDPQTSDEINIYELLEKFPNGNVRFEK